MKLNRAALDYLLAVANDLGYRAIKVETSEDYLYQPKITVTFEQTRETQPQPDPIHTRINEQIELHNAMQDARAGVTEKQAAEIAGKGKDKMRTLDDE